MRLNFLHETFFPIQKYNSNSTHIYNGEIGVDFPSYIISEALEAYLEPS